MVVARLLLVVLAILGSARAALACSCGPSGPACQAFWSAPVVFDAVARSVDQTRRLATLDVRHVWKGNVSASVVVPSGDGANCIYQFEAGKRYLVFAGMDRSNGRLSVSECSATRAWDGSGSDAKFLASLARPAGGGRIFGTVRRITRTGGGIPHVDEVPVVTSVRLISGTGQRTVRSTRGAFDFSGLAPGSYRLGIEVPGGYAVYENDRVVTIPNNRACSSQTFSLTDAAGPKR